MHGQTHAQFLRIGFASCANLVKADDELFGCAVAAQHLDSIAGDHFAAEHAEMAVEMLLLDGDAGGYRRAVNQAVVLLHHLLRFIGEFFNLGFRLALLVYAEEFFFG